MQLLRYCRSIAACLIALTCLVSAQDAPKTLRERIRAIISRPEFEHADWGIEFYSLQSGKVLYSLNANRLFTPASTTKVLTEGALLAKLGADFRFHTRVYHTGTVDSRGRLHGDLVLVASGDPNLSNRARPDGTLAWNDDDHIYGGPAVDGDPLGPIKELARQVAAKGIREIDGRVLVDTGGYPEERERGTGITVSSIVINDNVVDLVLKPGAKAGDPIQLQSSPRTSYVTFINHAVTTAPGTKPSYSDPDIKINPDGSVIAMLSGSMPADSAPVTAPFPVPSPHRFATTVFEEALRASHVKLDPPQVQQPADWAELARSYTSNQEVAEYVSLPLAQEIEVTLKVSHNVHANLGPYLLGRYAGDNAAKPIRAGFAVERSFLQKASLDLSGASQGDGAGGDWGDMFSPDFMCRYLAYWSTRPDFNIFFKALPILGKDGTLADIQKNSPAAGHVHAKTGTIRAANHLDGNTMLLGKGLVGYMTTQNGEQQAFAAYVNRFPLPSVPNSADVIAGEALGEIAAAAYDAPIEDDAAYDLIIRNGHVIDGTGNPWYKADIGIQGDRIAAIGDLHDAQARQEIDANGRVVSPGFIDMLGHSEMNLLLDNRALSKVSQGITTEITGERVTVAPQDDKTIAAIRPFLAEYKFNLDWTTLEGYFQRLQKQGTTLNLGTYVGSQQVREAVIGDDDRTPTPAELQRMCDLVAESMKEGALGLSSALIYPPNSYSSTDELIALAKVAARYGGIYATHIRSESNNEMEALDEAFRIGREAGLPVEIFHLKVAGKSRWGEMKDVIAKIDAARNAGLDVAADMYPYTAGATALASALPPWVADGGRPKLLERLQDPGVRARIRTELRAKFTHGENLYLESGGASGVLVSSVVSPELKQFEGKTLAEIASVWRKSPEDTLFDFIIADSARSGAIYFVASGDDLRLGLQQPWTSIGLDYGAMAKDGPTYEAHGHPRAWGSMPRFLGRFVRDEHLMPLETAIRKLTSLPASREHLQGRGLLKPGYFADITVFDPATIEDRSTYTNPTLLSQGVDYTIVNGKIEYSHGELTGVAAGQVLRGRGWSSPVSPTALAINNTTLNNGSGKP